MVKLQWIIYLILVLLPIVSQAQAGNLPEQLQRKLRETGPDTNRLQLLLKLGSHYLYRQGDAKSDLDSAFLYLHEAENLCETLRSKKEMSKTMLLIIKCYNEAKDLRTVRDICLSLIDEYQKSGDTEAEATIWHWLGTNMNRNDSIHPTNFYSLEQAGRCYQQLNNKEKQIEVLKEIADIHLTQGNLAKSEEELLRVLDMYKSIGFRDLHYTYDLLASVSILRGNLNRALFYGIEVIKNMEATGDSVVAETFYYRLARIYELLGQTAQSVEWYKRAYSKGNDANLVSLTRQAVPIGLILNEAISNAVKYAFPDKRAGVVAISMEHGEADQFKLIIADNGTGLPQGFDPRKSASLGMSLMRGLSKQLHGSFDLKNDDGLTITIVFATDKSFQSSAKLYVTEMMA